jgi:hypothetical protein
MSFSGIDQLQAYLRGDLDGDFDHDLSDFIVFRAAYEAAHGAGSFVSLFGNVPEPSSAALLVVAVMLSIFNLAQRRGGAESGKRYSSIALAHRTTEM